MWHCFVASSGIGFVLGYDAIVVMPEVCLSVGAWLPVTS